jgi:prepilin-type N-terminal cleavage/methylation domain-containing protein
MTAERKQSGFTLMEVLVALVITIIGLAGVLMMQASTVKSNRQNAEFTRASMIAEETLEGARSTKITTLLNGVTVPAQVYNGISYNITLTAQELSTGSNLVLITAAVTYSEDNDTSTADDRTARFQMIRTKTETL